MESTQAKTARDERVGGGVPTSSWLRRSFRRLSSIQVAVALWYMVTALFLFVLLDAYRFQTLEADLLEEHSRYVQSYARDLSAHVLEYETDNTRAIAAVREELSTYLPVQVEYRLADEDGTVVFATPAWKDAPSTEFRESGGRCMLAGESFLAIPLTIRFSDGREWRSVSAISLRTVDTVLAAYRRTAVTVIVPFVILSALGGAFLARKALRPVVRMAEIATAIGVNNLGKRLPVRGVGDEIDQLATAINSMLGRLEESFQRIEQFSADLAHELRTPITRLVGETEAALLRYPNDANRLRDVLATHAETYDSMSYMITDILQLLRAGTPGAEEELTVTTIGDLIDRVVEWFGPLAEDNEVRLEQDGSHRDAEIACVPGALRRALSNVVENAIRHSARGSSVTISTRRKRSSLLVTVSDHGAGIPKEDMDRIFERFFRGARARASGAPGFGLGLSIVKKIMDQHQGSVSVESTLGAGTQVTLTLPLAAPDRRFAATSRRETRGSRRSKTPTGDVGA